jgi:hypothetical protein
MFDFLKGNKVNVSIALTPPTLVYRPGDTIDACITIENEKELTIRGGHFIISSIETYQRKVVTRHTDGKGHTSTSIETRTDENTTELFRYDFLPEFALPPGKVSYQTSFTLSPSARPTCEGSIVKFAYLTKATLDRKMAADMNAEEKFQVMAVYPDQLSQAGAYGESNEPGEAQMVFTLPKKEFLNKGMLTGSLKIMPAKSFKVKAVRVELNRLEHVPAIGANGRENDSSTTLVKEQLADQTQLEPGQYLEFPFQFDLSKILSPSAQGDVGTIIYELKGILDRPLRSDTFASVPVEIFNDEIR